MCDVRNMARIFGHGMVWYGMYDTPRRLKIPSLLFPYSLTRLCIFVVLRGRDPFRGAWTVPNSLESVLPSPWVRFNAESLLSFLR